MLDAVSNARASALVSRVLVFAFASSLVACGLLYGFDRYDTDVIAVEAGAGDTAKSPADFDLVVADTLRVEPGTTGPLVVSVERRSGVAERIVVVVADPLPVGVERGAGATIEADASSATLNVTVDRHAPAITQTLHVQAASASGTRTRDIALTLRGLPCAPDRGFGLTADGAVRTTLFGQGQLVGLGLATTGDTITFGIANNDVAEVHRIDTSGAPQWVAVAPSDTLGLSVDSARGVVIVGAGALTRLVADGGADPTFGTGGNGIVVPSCRPTAITTGTSETSVICATAPAAFTSSRFDLAGVETVGEIIDFGPGIGAKLSASRESSGGGHIACGSVVDANGHPAFARWLASGKRDEAFGVAGRVALDAGGSARWCAADDAGVVGLDVVGVGAFLVAMSPSGAVDPIFGDGGFAPVQLDAGGEIASSGFALDTGALVVVASQGADGRVFVLRYLRDGRPDPTFGEGGQCALGALGLREVVAVIVTSDHKLLVLTTATGEGLLARIWL
jgi:hypothetical protein